MSSIVFDIECNGLKPTKIHCMSYKRDGGDVVSLSSYDDMRKLLSSNDTLIGHNIIRFDIPVLEKLLGVKVSNKLVDTLALSWYLEPDRLRHGLEWYGEEFGVKKPPVTDWDNLSTEEYIHRCSEDVRINSLLWKRQCSMLKELYENPKDADRLISYLMFKVDCAREQEEVRWKLDVKKCETTLETLSSERDDKLVELKAAMPKVPIHAVKNKPAKPYKMNGSLSKSGEDWKVFCENRGLDFEATASIDYIKDYEEPNPASSKQVKDWLYSLGWKPETFMYKRNKDTGDVKKIPQVAADKSSGGGLCPSVLKLIKEDNKVSVLNGLSVLNHRIAILNGFLNNNEDGYLKAEIDGLTNTLRFKHRVLVNLPGVQNPYGEDIRGCLVAPDGMELCGSDMSGLEDRLKQHYIYPYDPKYVDDMRSDDYDPHLDLALSAGAVTVGEATEYKSGNKSDKVKVLRHTYKQGNYACQYGAGVARLALTVGCDKKTAENIHSAYWKRNWAVKQAAEDALTKAACGRMWLYNPISKFWYSLRAEKDKFSTLVQGSAVFCFDSWVRNVRNMGWKVCGQFHDEVVIPIYSNKEGTITNDLKDAVYRLNSSLHLNRELDVDVQFGENYAKIH